jgi:hypothetical protein
MPLPAMTDARPVAVAAPAVESYDEISRKVLPGDSYRALSREYYRSEAYAEALQLFNRNHPRASPAAQRDGSLVPGDTVYIPPVKILEQRHGAVISAAPARPAAGAPGAPPAVVPASFVAPVAPADAPRPRYQVRQAPESWETIARITLRDSRRVGEIEKLNPSVPRGAPVAVGTTLVLPPGAQVPDENLPPGR